MAEEGPRIEAHGSTDRSSEHEESQVEQNDRNKAVVLWTCIRVPPMYIRNCDDIYMLTPALNYFDGDVHRYLDCSNQSPFDQLWSAFHCLLFSMLLLSDILHRRRP